jgi:tRNA dimethylallyltransferase
MSRSMQVITGPTAVGKTEWALAWAERHDAEILSCDSLLFYRGMDIGTAKPTAEERTRVPHHLIDIRSLREPMDVAEYVRLARTAAEEIAARGRRILVVGGSGFYLKAFFAPIADDVRVPEEIRREVAGLVLKEALERLRSLNPAGLGTLDVANPRRVARALERCLASGRTLAELSRQFASQPSAFADWKVSLLRLERPREELERRIEERVGRMLSAGLLNEVAVLVEQGLRDNPSARRAIGYRECLEVIDGNLARDRLAEAVIKSTRALVRKQGTWFRTQLPAHQALKPETR